MMDGFLKRFENTIDPFGDGEDAEDAAPRRVGELSPLPQTANGFIWHFAKQARWPLVGLLVTGGLTGGVEAVLYTGVGWVIDALGTSTPATLVSTHAWLLGWMLFLTLVGRSLILFAAAVLEEQVVTPSFYNRIRWQAYRRLMEQPYTFFQNDFAGRIAQKVQQVGEATGDFIITTLQTFWSFVTFVLLTVTILGALDPWMAVVIAVWSLGYAWIVRNLLPRIRTHGRATADARSVVSGRVVDSFTNILSVKLFDSAHSEDAFVKDGFKRFLLSVRRLTRALTAVRTAVAVLNGIMMTAIGILAVAAWQRGGLSSGGVATALGLVLRLNQMSGWMMFNINGLVRNYGTIQDAVATVTVLPTLLDKPNAPELQAPRGEIRFEKVVFHYGKGGGVIDDLSLTIWPGEKIGLVGRSGAGKTTVVNLLLRLYEVEGGRILIDGADIADVTQASLRARIGVVTQDTSLLHRSIRDNIAYGRPDADEAEVMAAAVRANAEGFIPGLRDPSGRSGFDAHVGERGIKLSGGQRQRIAIAHRLSTIAALDRLIVLDEGRIVEEGSHAELIRRGGLYADLWARQSGGFLDSEAAE